MQFALGQMNALPEQTAGAEQAEVIINVRVVHALRKLLAHEFYFARAFGQVGLHQTIWMLSA